MNFAERLKLVRKQKGLTQKELADLLGIPYQGISQYERGIRNPKYQTIEKLAKALECDISDLISPKQEAQMILDMLCGVEQDDLGMQDEFIEMLKSPIMQKLGVRWMEQTEKEREQTCIEQGWPFVKCEEPYYSRFINGHLANLLIDNGVCPSSYESLISAGFTHGDAFSLMSYAKKDRKSRRGMTEDQYQREEEVAGILDRIAQRDSIKED